jgi:hypothetical protein
MEIVPRPSMLADIQGIAMWWFSKGQRKEIWDENIQWPIGDIEAAHRIRDICRSAADSAEKVSGFADRPDSNKNNYETERYERAAKVAMEIAIKISDDLLRDSSVRQIVSLCVKANDLRTANIGSRDSSSIDQRRCAEGPSGASAVNLLAGAPAHGAPLQRRLRRPATPLGLGAWNSPATPRLFDAHSRRGARHHPGTAEHHPLRALFDLLLHWVHTD